MEQQQVNDNVWQSEEEFKKLVGNTTELKAYRTANPGLWRVTAAGKTIYNITAWMNQHTDVRGKTG